MEPIIFYTWKPEIAQRGVSSIIRTKKDLKWNVANGVELYYVCRLFDS